MDWLRRNWPDLLIGIALVAVIAGIIATLITGGSFFSVGTTTTTVPPGGTSQSTPTVPAPDDTPVPVVPDPADSGETATDTPEIPTDTSGPTVSVLPPSDNAAPAADPAGDTAPQVPVVEVPAPETADAAPAAAPVAVGDAPAPSSDPAAPFRVSVGAFSTLENAERQAEVFRAAGYPVLIGAQGALSLVLIGPYSERVEAERVAAQVEAAGLVVDPIIYTFEPGEDSEISADTPAPAAGTPAPAADTPTPADTPAVAAPAESGRFIQVGAYASDESAAPQRQRLAELGFSVSSRVENGLVKLLIGPFGDQQLRDAQVVLDAAEIPNFVR